MNDTNGTADLSSTGSPTITHSHTEGMTLNKQGSASKYVSIPLGDIGMDSGKSWSLSWWYKIGSGVNWEDVVILGTRDYGSNYGLHILPYSTYQRYGFYDNDVDFHNGWTNIKTKVTNNNWVHFVYVYDKDNDLGDGTHRKKAYADGVELTNNSGQNVHNAWTGNNTSHRLDIGGWGMGHAINGNQHWLNLAIFDKALSLAEAQAIYAKDKYYGYGYDSTPISSISGSGVSCGTTSERDNLTYVEEGDVFYNTETSELQIYKNSVWRSLSHKIANDRNAFKITSGDSVPTVDSNSKEGNIYYNTNTGKLRIREESAWQVTSKQSITDRAEFKTLYGASTPSVNTIQNVFYNTDTKKLQYLKNDSWRTVAEEEVAGDTFNVGVDSYKFSLNNAVQPELNLYRGNEYVFNQSSADNSGQRLFVSNDLSGRVGSNELIPTSDTYADKISDEYYEYSSTYHGDNVYDQIISDDHTNNHWHSKQLYLTSTVTGEIQLRSGYSDPLDKPYVGLTFKNNIQHKVGRYRIWPRAGYNNDLNFRNARPKGWILYGAASQSVFDSGGGVQIHSHYFEGDATSALAAGNWKSYDSTQRSNGLGASPADEPDGFNEYYVTNPGYYNFYAFVFTHGYDINFDGNPNYTYIVINEIALYSQQILTENTTGFSSTGTLGTDLVSTWTIPTDASDTMYYASDGSANAGGKINITNVPAQEKTFVVDVSLNRFTLGGLVQPTLNLYRDSVYKFDQSDPDNVGQRLYVSNDLDGGQRGVVGNKLPDVAMTSNDTTDCETSVSSQYSDWSAFKAFNHVIGDEGWHSAINVYNATTGYANTGGADSSFQGYYGQWIKIRFKTKSFFLKELKVYPRAGYYGDSNLRAPDDGYVFGSLDGTTWTELLYFTAITNSGNYQSNVGKIINVSATTAFSYYVLLTTKLSGGVGEHNVNISEIELYPWDGGMSINTNGVTSAGTLGTDLVTTWRVPTDASDTMYYASDGSANMGGTISITDAPTKTTRVRTLVSAGSNGGGDTYTKYAVDVSLNRFTIGGHLQPTLNLYKDSIYKFDQSDPDNVGQRLYVSNDVSGRKLGLVDSIIYEIPSNLTTTNYFNGSSTNVVLGSDVTFDWSKDWEIKTSFTINQSGPNHIYPRIFSFVSNLNHGASATHSEFDLMFDNNGKRIGLMIKDPYPFPSTQAVWISGQNEGTLVNDELLLNTRYNVLVKYVYSTGVITAGYQLHSNFTSWDDVIIQGTKFVDSSLTGNGGYGSPITFTGSITYQTQNSRIGDRSTNDRKFNGTIHSLTMTNRTTTTTTLTENTAGVTSTGTLGTDLVSTWRVPTDASDTMYYASDGSANAGGKINVEVTPYEEKTYAVDVSLNAFTLGGLVQPTLNLYRDSVYNFDQSDPDNVGQRLYVSNDLSGGQRGVVGNKLPDVAMTSNNMTDFEASASSQNSDWAAFRAFNHVIGKEGWHDSMTGYTHGVANGVVKFTPMNIDGEWIKIRFIDISKMIKEIHIYQRTNISEASVNYWSRAPDEGYIYGSNDDSNWTELIHFTGLASSGGYSSYQDGVPKIITLNSSTAYEYFVIVTTKLGYIHNVSRVSDGITLNISEIELYPWDGGMSINTTGVTSTGTLGTDLVTRWRVPTDASDTMYYASDGSANAGGTINIFNNTNDTTTPTIVCVTTSSAVNVISSGGNKYRFNGDTTYVANKYYGLGAGTFTFTGVPSGHPIAILNAGKTSLISYTGDNANKSSKTVSGTTSDGTYDFYHGDVTVTVSGDFGSVSVYCVQHGYMGGENLLRYSSSCDVPSPPSGGIETQYGGYRIHTFTSSGTFEVYNNIDVSCLIIGGGGGGTDGDDTKGGGGGGGAGGFLEVSQNITPGQYTIVVGAGGIGSQLGVESSGVNGNNSSFNENIALGGGANSSNGGCGGGAFRGATPGSGSQGGDGGTGGTYLVVWGGGGGGGGANENGGNGVNGQNVKGGNGGNGKSSNISGTATVYAGGGGGGSQDTVSSRPSGGAGGGGDGGGTGSNSYESSGLDGTDGLGGGGGGSSAGSGQNDLAAGKGGDGIVIIRYLL